MSTYRILIGDCRETLAELPEGSVQTVVTSPPYYGLRDYGTAEWEGGDPECDHRPSTLSPTRNEDRRTFGDSYATHPSQLFAYGKRQECDKCGATKHDQQIGLEESPDAYVEQMVEVFRAVRRVLRDDGTVWLNLGDSYAGSMRGSFKSDKAWNAFQERAKTSGYSPGVRARTPYQRTGMDVAGLKPKDLIGVPWRVAFALQADGWWLRSAIVWSKPNPMPESVTDRPTSAYEFVFLLAKSARYFYDADAIAEEAKTEPHAAGYTSGAGYAVGPMDRGGHSQREGDQTRIWAAAGTRNARNVWTITTKPYAGAHFATFPPELAERCILAGTSQRGCCSECGAPWERVVERTFDEEAAAAIRRFRNVKHASERNDADNHNLSGVELARLTSRTDKGWRPTCDHDAPVTPCTVLDPFAGSGTTGMVATGHGRKAILCELNPEYADLIRERCGPMLEAA